MIKGDMNGENIRMARIAMIPLVWSRMIALISNPMVLETAIVIVIESNDRITSVGPIPPSKRGIESKGINPKMLRRLVNDLESHFPIMI